MSNLQYGDQRDLFKLALGFSDPWKITEVSFSREDGRLDIFLKHERGAHFPCPSCEVSCGAYDTTDRTWRHLNFFQYETYLHAPTPRIHCRDCNITRVVTLPWARPNSGFTLLFEALVMQLAQAMPLSTVGAIVGEYDTRLMRVIDHYVGQGREEVDMSEVESIGTDETSKAKGHDYITSFIDLKKRRVLFVTEGKDNTTVQRFVEDLEQHGGHPANIKEACIDLSPAFTKGIKENLPEASIVYDRFHVMKIITDAQDAVRREESRDNEALKGSRYALLHNPETATDKQGVIVAALTKLNLKTVRAYQIRLAMREVYLMTDYKKAEAALKRWYFWATHSRIEPIIRAAKTIKAHWDGVLAFFRNRTANGLAEGINSVIQTIKRRARGYGNTKNFITMIYLVCGKLDFRLPRVCGVNPR
jgi:transposase